MCKNCPRCCSLDIVDYDEYYININPNAAIMVILYYCNNCNYEWEF